MTDLTQLEKPKYTLTGMYRGLVEDNDDPLDAGRVKVRVFGVSDDPLISVSQLPWAEPALNMHWSGGYNVRNADSKPLGDANYSPGANSKVAGTDDKSIESADLARDGVYAEEKADARWNACGTGGQFVVPKRGNKVFLFFEAGNPMKPIYFAMATDARDWRTQKDVVGADIFQKLAQLKAFSTDFLTEEAKNLDTTPAPKDNWASGALVDSKTKSPSITISPIISEHPNKDMYSVTSPNGTTIIIDNSKGKEKLYLIHKNTIDHIDQDGNKKLYVGKSHSKLNAFTTESETNIPCNFEIGVEGNHDIYVAGNWKVYAIGDIGIKSQGNIQIESAKNVGISVQNGDIDLIVKNGNINAQVAGNINANVTENANIKVDGNCNVKIAGDLKASIGGAANITCTTNTNIQTKGDMNLTVGGSFKLSATSIDMVSPTMKMSGEMNIGGNTKVTGTVSATQDVVAGNTLYSTVGIDTGGFLRNRGPADIGSPVTAHILQVIGGAGSGTGRPPESPQQAQAPEPPAPPLKEVSKTEIEYSQAKVIRQNTPDVTTLTNA